MQLPESSSPIHTLLLEDRRTHARASRIHFNRQEENIRQEEKGYHSFLEIEEIKKKIQIEFKNTSEKNTRTRTKTRPQLRIVVK